ncbi:hypothetical protein [Mycolicibacterium sphagni]|uniref:hypothetical protein n=1 Tax=Mycolicibacterium sphagni TaxID=1786 RepID=UPI0010553438|nr:hypothetical protein [Mycolicibacterium sphagni]
MASDQGQIVEWLSEESLKTLDRRVTVVPSKGHLDMADEAVQAFASNDNLHSGRGTPGAPGGPALAYYPDIERLADAVRLAQGQPLGVIEFFPDEMAGWAAAANAINLTTGAPTPSVSAEVHAALVDLRDAGYEATVGIAKATSGSSTSRRSTSCSRPVSVTNSPPATSWRSESTGRTLTRNSSASMCPLANGLDQGDSKPVGPPARGFDQFGARGD